MVCGGGTDGATANEQMRRRGQRRWSIRTSGREKTPVCADVRKSLDAALASSCRNEAMRAGAGRQLLRDQLPGISTVGFSGRGARARHRWLVLRRRCPFSAHAKCCGTSWSCAMYHCACRYLSAHARRLSLEHRRRHRPNSRASRPPASSVSRRKAAFLPLSDLSVLQHPPRPWPLTLLLAHHLRITLRFLGVRNRQKAYLAFPLLLAFALILIGSLFTFLFARYF